MEIAARTLVMMAGLPGAGKTTLAYALQEELGWHVIDKDKHRILLITQGVDPELAASEAYERSFAEIRYALNEGQVSIIFDTAALHRSILDSVSAIIAEVEGVRLRVILCVLDRDERNYRLRTRAVQHTRITVEPATIADYLQYFEHLPEENRLTLFTNLPPLECLAEAKRYVTGEM